MKKILFAFLALMSISITAFCLSGCCAHVFTDTVVAPTCTEEGYTLHECSQCKRSYKSDIVQPTGHTEGDWIVEVAETCTTDGQKYKQCTVCGEKTQTKTIYHGHDFQHNKCSRCGTIHAMYPYIELPANQVMLGYFYVDSLESNCIVRGAKVEDKTSLGVYMYTSITLTIEKLFDRNGENYERSCFIKYKVYESTSNIVADSGSAYSTSVAVGDITTIEISLRNLTGGKSYKLELLDYIFSIN